MARIFLITGVMASGKSTVAQALAERLPRSVHVRGDAFRRMVVNGRADVVDPPSADARAQLALRYRAAATTARLYADAGFDVVVQDVMLGPALRDALAWYAGLSVYLTVLCPQAACVAERERGRDKSGYGGWTVAALDAVLRRDTPRLGHWLDSSDLDVAQTVDALLANLGTARLAAEDMRETA